MYGRLSLNPTQFFPYGVPALSNPPTAATKVEEEHRPFPYKENIRQIIASVSTSNISGWVDFDKVFLLSIKHVPSVIYESAFERGCCIDTTMSTANYNISKHNVAVASVNDFAACFLYGITKLAFHGVEDEGILRDLYISYCSFLYSLIIKMYLMDFEIINKKPNDIAKVYYLISKYVACNYFETSGNRDVMAYASLVDFAKKTYDRYSFTGIKTNDMPKQVDCDNFENICKYLDQSGIFEGFEFDELKKRIVQKYSVRTLIGLGNGYELAGMLAASKLTSKVLPDKIKTISMKSVNQVITTADRSIQAKMEAI